MKKRKVKRSDEEDLFKSPTNARRLNNAIRRAIKRTTKPSSVDSLRKEFGL